MTPDNSLDFAFSRVQHTPMRLLIIEDDRDAAEYLVKAFREAGHVADHAADGLDGYATAREGGYDVLVVDRMLPKLDGLSLIRSLREQGVDTPVLILSALGQVDDRVKGLRAGGDACCPTSRLQYAAAAALIPPADRADGWRIRGASYPNEPPPLGHFGDDRFANAQTAMHALEGVVAHVADADRRFLELAVSTADRVSA